MGRPALRRKRALDRLALAAPRRCCSPRRLASPIRLESPGSPIYRQRRVGRDGEPFDVFKLRTMVTGAEHMGAGLAVSEGDTASRASGACCGARRSTSCRTCSTSCAARCRSSARGPTVPVQVDRYTERQRGRLAVKPGITGWAQVNGRT